MTLEGTKENKRSFLPQKQRVGQSKIGYVILTKSLTYGPSMRVGDVKSPGIESKELLKARLFVVLMCECLRMDIAV